MHTFNPQILREYDIRGTFGDSLNVEDALSLGLRFAYMMRSQNFKTVSVARDGRLSSPALISALIDGLIQGDIDVIDVGLGPTPMLYYSIKHLKTDAGIMVTGSHNPSQDNGFKMALTHRPFFGKDIQALAITPEEVAPVRGTVQQVSVQNDYIERLLQDYTPGNRRLKIAFDPGNGAAGHVVEVLAQLGRLNIDCYTINTKIDGTFPAHHPDPTVAENLEQLIDLVRKENCDAGIAFDGDADRIGVVDSKGRILWGDQLMVLWSRDVLKRHPGATIIADVKASQVLFDDIANHGGHAIMARTGHSLIKSKIAETGALLAGEMSGHIFFADTYYGYDDALYAAIRLLNILHDSVFSLADLFDQIPKRINTPEIRIPCTDERKFQIVEEIKGKLRQSDVKLNDIDGVRVTTDDGWWLLRASNTQAILVARCESDTHEGLSRLQAQLEEYLEPFRE